MKTCRFFPPKVPYLLTFSILVSIPTGCSSVYEVFADADNSGTLHCLVVNRNGGRVYVGATNRLYQLSGTLDLEATVENGPREDSPNCPPPTSECHCFGSNCKDSEKTRLDSVSKAIVIDYRGDRLISCINLYQGHCDKHLLTNISNKDSSIWTMLVPNDEDSPAVMFIAPGPPNPASTEVLYVAATRSTKGLPAYKDIVPAICMRSLQDLNFVSDDILTPSRIDIEVQQRDQFRVQYIYGFASMEFSYFLMVQKSSALSDSDQLVTQMSRICQNDKSLYSYTEVPLECRHRGVAYGILRAAFLVHPGTDLAKSLGLAHIGPLTDMEHVLVAVFTNHSSTSRESSTSSSSALCVYSMREIRRTFTETIQKCFRGTGNTGPDHFVQPKICQSTPLEISDDYCGQHDLNHPIKGTDPVLAQAVVVWNGINVTSVAVTQTTNFTVAFVGTDNGYLKKVTLESRQNATEFGSLLIEKNGSIVSLTFDPVQEHVYVMTRKKVFRIPVQNCSQYTDCEQCLGSRDPYCGWCSQDRSCGLKVNCSGVDGDGSWLPYDSGQCPRVVALSSTQTQILARSTSTVVMTVSHLPLHLLPDLECAFSGYGVMRTTRVKHSNTRTSRNSTLECHTPTTNLLPPFPTGKDHIVMNLSLMSDDHNILSVTNYTFFDCSTHNTCTLCTKSRFPCIWCVKNHSCTNNREGCKSDVLITGKQVPENDSGTPGPEYCPRIEVRHNSTEILVSNGSDTRLVVNAVHLQDFQSSFRCVFNFNGGVERNGVLLTNGQDSSIECDPVLFTYSGSSPYLNVPFGIFWGSQQRPLDNPNSVQVRVFKCSRMALNCGLCRSISATHKCGWCTTSSTCTMQNDCHSGPWLSEDKPCHNPVVLEVFPSSGPVEGGTNLTIRGENLGLNKNDTTAMIASHRCRVSHYVTPSAEMVCVTGPSEEVKAPVVLKISGKYEAQSTAFFSYVKPEVHSFQPDRGPSSGGTLLTIFGRYLDAGSGVSVVLTNATRSWKVPCVVVSREESSVVCATGRSPPLEANFIQLEMDNRVVNYSDGNFTFVSDPSVSTVDPEKSIVSGGVRINVSGERLDSVREPKLVIYLQDRNVSGPCKVLDEGKMTCVSPSLEISNVVNPVALHYGFVMDNVQSLLNISGSGLRGTMLVYSDPTFDKFDSGVKQFFYSKNEHLVLNGKNINLVLTEGDYRVSVGGAECVVMSVTSTQLTCLPSEQSAVLPSASVVVHIGNSSVDIGSLSLDTSQSVFTLTTIIIVAVIAIISLAIILIIFIAYRRKTKESERVVRLFTNRMNTLEARVATECKEAFAELQTDMVHVTSDICAEGGGIPFRNYSSFCVRVMFPEDQGSDHPIMRPFDADNPSTEKAERGLDVFNQLIGNRTFLLIFIRVLEQQPNFTMREKVNVASLLSVTLQNRMEYHTDILKTLLAELIERAISGIHPKLLLRRTESVAEKMLTNWFTFLLYKFLKESAGEPLFLLFRAIKQQIEKGPIDALTSEAKYSLSEDKLIRQQIDFKIMTLTIVIDLELRITHDVKVLNCDTVTQVKEKILDAIYRSAPFSARPDKDNLDLEWLNCPPRVKGRYILQDEDATTNVEGDVRRLNTLAHYQVPRDGARMTLIARRMDSVVNLALSSEKLPLRVASDGFYNGSLPHSRSLSTSHTINFLPETGAKCYHLVKSQENEYNKNAKVDQCNKLVSEIYLTRLLATKMALDQFVKTLFETIFSAARRGSSLPLAIKHLFDFLDDQALLHGITDPEVVHTWKSNSLPLRFWVNVIKNPDFIFDVHKSNIVDSCLSVVAQTFMDSCSMSEHKLSKDSPSSKLLYAKDIPFFKDLVISYYEDIKNMPSVSEQEIQAMLREESQIHKNEFSPSAALYELYRYTAKYKKNLMEELDADEFACRSRLTRQLEIVHSSMEPEV